MAAAEDRAPVRLSFGLSAAGAGALLALHLARLPYHEMWRDEWQTWLTARDSAGLGDLITNTRYDGHPMFWMLLVWLLSKVTTAPWAMQVLHALIAAAGSFVLLRYAPFPRWVRALAVLGYFPFFEYAVISRNYALGLLFAGVACALLVSQRARPRLLGSVLFLLAWTSALATLLAIALLAVVATELVKQDRLPALARRREALTAFAVGSIGIACAIVDGLPSADSGFATAWRWQWDASLALRAAAAAYRGLLPLPQPGLHFWNSNLLDEFGRWEAVLGAAGVGLVVWLLRTARARLYWLCAVVLLAGFSYVKLVGETRHQGFYFLALGVSCWLDGRRSAHLLRTLRTRFAQGLSAIFLGVHVLIALYASAMDLRHPFSASLEVARWLRAHDLARLPIVGETDTQVSPLAGLLDEPLFYVRGERWGTFIIYDRARAPTPDRAAIVAAVDQVAAERRSAVLLVLSRMAELEPLPAGWRRLEAFPDSISPTETYAVYLAPVK